jgi:hypothetical protein
MKKLFASTLLFVFAWSFIALAQSPAPSVAPSASPAIAAPAVVAAQSGIMGWVVAHGGYQAAILLLMTSALALLSAIRTVLFKFEGINEDGSNIPANSPITSTINKVCRVLGTVIDFMMGNPQH